LDISTILPTRISNGVISVTTSSTLGDSQRGEETDCYRHKNIVVMVKNISHNR
jgi:hypothetical protein